MLALSQPTALELHSYLRPQGRQHPRPTSGAASAAACTACAFVGAAFACMACTLAVCSRGDGCLWPTAELAECVLYNFQRARSSPQVLGLLEGAPHESQLRRSMWSAPSGAAPGWYHSTSLLITYQSLCRFSRKLCYRHAAGGSSPAARRPLQAHHCHEQPPAGGGGGHRKRMQHWQGG